MTVDEYEFRTQLIASQIETCKQLASNDVKIRKKGLRRLRAFLGSDDIGKSGIEDFGRIWTGLFTYVWMSDTPLVQEADVDEISNLIHRILNFDAATLFVRGFFMSITNQWDRISHYRTDKFLMFIRRFLRQILFLLKNSGWNCEKILKISSEFYSAIQMMPVELTHHFNDIYTEELAKVSEGCISTDALAQLLKCFVDCIVQQKPSKAVTNHININVFVSLVRQLKILIKQKAAVDFDPEQFSLEEPEVECSSNFDPRPGNAHVFLPYIDFDENKMIEFLEASISSAEVSQKAKNIITQNIQMLRSVTRLRESIPSTIPHEVNEKEKKRKRKSVKFSSLVEKACRKLDDEEDCFSTKKMKKLLRSSVWEVTQNVDNDAKTAANQGWSVRNLQKKARSVSFSDEVDIFHCETDPECRPSTTSAEPITVPKSACDDRPGVLIPEKNYSIVEFRSLEGDEKDSKCSKDAGTVPKNNEKRRKTKSISPRKTRSGRMPTVGLEETAITEPPWITTQFVASDSVETPQKNERKRRTTPRKSSIVQIPEQIEEVPRTRSRKSNLVKILEQNEDVSSRSRKSNLTKTVRIDEAVESPKPKKSDSVELAMKDEKVKPRLSRCTKSDMITSPKTSKNRKSIKRGISETMELPTEDEKAEKIRRSIAHVTKYEPRKTRSGRIYNVDSKME